MNSPFFEFRGIGKRFFGVPVLTDISLGLSPGRALGLAGENGAGKSTLMNILGGVFTPDSGAMLLEGQAYAPRYPAEARRAGISLVHQELNLFPNLSIAENIFLTDFPRDRRFISATIDRAAMHKKTRSLLAALDLHVEPERLVEELPPGERQMVEIVKGLHSSARIIVFDEPTTSLTRTEAERLFGIISQLRARGLAIVYISHNLQDVERICDDVAVLRDGTLQVTGPVSKFPPAEMIRAMERDIEQLYPERTPLVDSTPVLEVRDVSQPGVCRDVNLTVQRGEILGIAGLMGSGRTELLRILFGLDPYTSGTIAVDGQPVARHRPRAAIRAGMAMLTEDRRHEGLLPEASVRENIVLAALRSFVRAGPIGAMGFLDRNRATTAAREMANRLDVVCAQLERQSVKTLSGGNQQKVVLAKWLLNQPRVLLLDEPTRGIDVGAKEEIYHLIAQLAADGAAVLMVSSEIEELAGMCDRILVMVRGEVRATLERSEFDEQRILKLAFGEEVLL